MIQGRKDAGCAAAAVVEMGAHLPKAAGDEKPGRVGPWGVEEELASCSRSCRACGDGMAGSSTAQHDGKYGR